MYALCDIYNKNSFYFGQANGLYNIIIGIWSGHINLDSWNMGRNKDFFLIKKMYISIYCPDSETKKSGCKLGGIN